MIRYQLKITFAYIFKNVTFFRVIISIFNQNEITNSVNEQF